METNRAPEDPTTAHAPQTSDDTGRRRFMQEFLIGGTELFGVIHQPADNHDIVEPPWVPQPFLGLYRDPATRCNRVHRV